MTTELKNKTNIFIGDTFCGHSTSL